MGRYVSAPNMIAEVGAMNHILEKTSSEITACSDAIANFCNDDSLSGEAIESAKAYYGVVYGTMLNDLKNISADMNQLSASMPSRLGQHVGNIGGFTADTDLLNAQIMSLRKRQRQYSQTSAMYSAMASSVPTYLDKYGFGSAISAYYSAMADHYNQMAQEMRRQSNILQSVVDGVMSYDAACAEIFNGMSQRIAQLRNQMSAASTAMNTFAPTEELKIRLNNKDIETAIEDVYGFGTFYYGGKIYPIFVPASYEYLDSNGWKTIKTVPIEKGKVSVDKVAGFNAFFNALSETKHSNMTRTTGFLSLLYPVEIAIQESRSSIKIDGIIQKNGEQERMIVVIADTNSSRLYSEYAHGGAISMLDLAEGNVKVSMSFAETYSSYGRQQIRDDYILKHASELENDNTGPIIAPNGIENNQLPSMGEIEKNFALYGPGPEINELGSYDIHVTIDKAHEKNLYSAYLYKSYDGSIMAKPIIFQGDKVEIGERNFSTLKSPIKIPLNETPCEINEYAYLFN